MDFVRRWPRHSWLGLVGLILAASLSPGASAYAQCTGHQLLSKPRAETSCQTIAVQIFASPDKAMHAVVYPADIALEATPDTESRVVIRSSAGATANSRDFSSPRGSNGYYVAEAKWSPDSQYFAFSLISSGGHSPWSFPIWIYGRKQNAFASFSDMISGNPTLAEQIRFTAPHSLVTTTWKKPGSPDDKVPVTVDLEAAFAKLPPAK